MIVLPDDSAPRHARVTFVDARGNPALVDGAPVWSSSNETALTVAADPDGLGATLTVAGPLGTGQINVTGDADLGEGVVPVAATDDFEIVGGMAVGAQIELDPA